VKVGDVFEGEVENVVVIGVRDILVTLFEMPVENLAEGVPVEIAGRVVDILFLVVGLWTVFVTSCV